MEAEKEKKDQGLWVCGRACGLERLPPPAVVVGHALAEDVCDERGRDQRAAFRVWGLGVGVKGLG